MNKTKYLFSFLVPLLIFFSLWSNNFLAYSALFFLFTVIPVLESLGYKIEIDGDTIFISSAPVDLDESLIVDFLQDYLRSMQDDIHFTTPFDRGVYLLSRKMAVRKGVMLTEPEMRDLLARFGKLGEDNIAPNGKRIFFVTDLEWMNKQIDES